MNLKKLTTACSTAALALFGGALPAQAQISGDVIRIGKTVLMLAALCGPDFTWGSDDDG